ncbi:MAG: hypothetical protein ACO1OX_09800 [Novosphingobium sp.]
MKRLVIGAAMVAATVAVRAEDPATSISYQEEIVPILEQNCATCHLTGEEAGGMSLVGDMAIGFLVGKPSQEVPAVMRVEPGAPERSYLVMKLEGTHLDHGGSGARMPLGGSPLDGRDLARIRAWIAQGAKS